MTRSGQRILSFFLVVLAGISPALAQQQQQQQQQQPTTEDRVQRLEEKLDELLRQAAEIRTELQQLRPASTTTPAEAPEEDLTKVDVAAAPGTPATPPLTDVQPVENTSTASAGKVFNPDISVIGTFLGHAGDGNPLEHPGVGLLGFGGIGSPLQFRPYLTAGEERAPFALDEAEVAFEAFIDPYAKGRFFISVGPEGAELEEGYAQFVTLPWGLTAKAGKTKAAFGKANTWHTHTRPWVDQPMMVTRFFGEEGFNDTGVSVSKIINTPGNLFIEATAEAFGGDVDGVFARDNSNDLAYNAHLKLFRDLTENSNLEAGASWARGNLAVPELPQFPDIGIGFPVDPFEFEHGRNQFTGVDLTYRWKPLSRSIYRSFIARFEGLANDRADFGETLYGGYLSADMQFAQRWFTGVRLDRADRFLPFATFDDILNPSDFDPRRLTDRGISATLTFWPSEFSQIRGQFRRTRYANGPSFNELLLQLQFAIGAHGAHTF
ncbi:MAG: hypothetical protein QOH21_1648 [Acidobacteriota bacterium]|jgi:hypothetical protein|nr:hypothetical protein [Acidobacteriota bacterium]